VGKAKRCVALSRVAHRVRGVIEPVHVRKLFARKPGDPRGDRLRNTVGPVGEGQWPNARYVRAWEVGRRNSIDEANEQRCSTGDMRPTTGGVCGEKSFGQGELCPDDGDQHTEAGISLERTGQSTRNKRSSVFPLRGCCMILPDSMFLRLTRGRSRMR
jgi:hypothetical protein